MNDIPNHLTSTTMMFTDDTLLYNRCSPTQMLGTTQKSLDQANEWCGKWLLKTNAEKCESMKFTKARNPAVITALITNESIKYQHASTLE